MVTKYQQLIGYSDEQLASVDPLVMNLLVAKSIPTLADLDIPHYARLADQWAADVQSRLPAAEQVFWQSPQDWKNDVNFFRLGVLCGYLEHEAGIAYNEAQRNIQSIRYTNPSDLFLNGVIDTRRGTCGNMAALHVAIGRRLGWPVSLACVRAHLICRYDDGKVTHNIEATQSGYGGFKSDPDEYLIRQYRLSKTAITCGSDLRAVAPREMFGIFVGLRARHMWDTGDFAEAEKDYLLARYLFPANRHLHVKGTAAAVLRSTARFDPDEDGCPFSLAAWIEHEFLGGVAANSVRPIPSRDVTDTIFARI